MRAKLIKSESLFDASMGVLNNVKENRNGKYQKHIIIVPDRATFIAERRLLEVLQEDCFFDCDILTFDRLCAKLHIEADINKQGGMLLLHKILNDLKDELKFFNNMQDKLGFANELYATILQIKSSGITSEVFDVVSTDDELLKYKLDDIKLIFKQYEKELENHYVDGVKKFNKLIKMIPSSEYIKNTAFYFAFFDALTIQEYSIIDTLIANENYCCIACNSPNKKSNEHIFTNEIYENIKAIFLKYGLSDEQEIEYVYPKYFEHIKKELFSFRQNKKELIGQDVQIVKAFNETEEIENLAKFINFEVYNGRRYKDFVIAVSNPDRYYEVIEKAFKNYKIPYYIDKTNNLLNNELSRFILSIVEGYHYNFMNEDLKKIIFNYFFDVDKSIKDDLYKLIDEYEIRGIKWTEKQYSRYNIDLKSVRSQLNFYVNLLNDCSTAYDYVNAINEIIDRNDIENKLQSLIELTKDDLVSQKTNSQIYDKLKELLNQIIEISGDIELDDLTFYSMLKSGLENFSVNVVPTSIDNVYIGDAMQSTFDRAKVVCLIGANFGLMPSIMGDNGIITDKDIDKLASSIKIDPKIYTLNVRAKYKVFELCIGASKELYVSYLVNSESGEDLKPSLFVENLISMFTQNGNQLKVQTAEPNILFQNDEDEIVKNIGCIENAKNILLDNMEYAHFDVISAIYEVLRKVLGVFSANDYIIKKEIKEEIEYGYSLFFPKHKTSISQITEYMNCPYKHFLHYGLKLQENKKISFDNLDVGIFLHRVAELFVNHYKYNIIQNQDELEQIKQDVLNKVLCEFKEKVENENNKYIVKGLINEVGRLIDTLYKVNKHSKFKNIDTEHSFKNYRYSVENEDDIEVVGKIDRIDGLDDMISIYDYKTGKINLDEYQIYYGLKLQLFIYALALKAEKDCSIIGLSYFPISDKYMKNDMGDDSEGLGGDKIEGLYLANEDILRKLDDTLQFTDSKKYVSDFYEIFIKEKADGNIDFNKNCISSENFSILLNYTNKFIENVLKELKDGNIAVSPKKDGEKVICEYCHFSGICKREIYAKERNLSKQPKIRKKENKDGVSD